MDGLVPPRWFRLCARVGAPATLAGFAAVALAVVGGLAGLPGTVSLALGLGGALLIAVGVAVAFLPLRPAIEPRRVAPPVAGRWSALNSPASRVPSHGTNAYGQTFAIDLVHEPTADARPRFGAGPGFREPEEFPGFGREVVAPADGRVVAVRDGARDHRSRSTWPAFAYMVVEGFVRELGGPRFLLGNVVVLDLGDGSFATLAHLQQGSAAVEPGRTVRRGELLGRCGNSGNSSEPHVHLQLADRSRALVAAGLPFVFAGVEVEGAAGRDALPANEQVMDARSERRVGLS